MAFIKPLYLEEGVVYDDEYRRIAVCCDISSPQQLENVQPLDEDDMTIIVNLQDWQVTYFAYLLRK